MVAIQESPGQAVRRLTWLAAGLAAVASVMRGLAAEQHLHDWGPSAVVVIVAAAQMLFAVLLLVGPWSGRTRDGRTGNVAAARALHLFGILGTSLVLVLDLLPPSAGAQPLPASGATEVVSTLDVLSAVAQVALIVVLLAVYAVAGRSTPASRPVDGPSGRT